MSLLTFLFFTIVFIALLSPFIQTYVAHKTTKLISEQLNFPVDIKSVRISWLDEIIIEDLSIKDKKGKTMISIARADVDYNIFSIFVHNTIDVDKVTLTEARVKLVNDKVSNQINLYEFLDAITKKMQSNKSEGKAPAFSIDKVVIQNSYFEWDNERYGRAKDRFDEWHFGFDSVYASVSNFKIAADTFQILVQKLKCREIFTKIKVKEVNTAMRLTSNTMEFGKIKAHVGNSYVSDSLSFKFKSVDDFGTDFFNKITIYTQLDSTIITSKDLAYFEPYLKKYNEKWNISCKAKGKVTNFSVNNLRLKYGKNSRVEGKISFNGLPNFFETFIEAKLKKTHIEAGDMAQYFEGLKAFETIKRFNRLNTEATFTGFPKDFVAEGDFETDLGNFTSDLNLKLHDNEKESYYKGNLITHQFQLGNLLQISELGKVDMKGEIEGTGFSLDHAQLKIDAFFERIGIKNYDYKNIKTKAVLENRFFDGYLSIKDSNLVAELDGEVDLRNKKDSIGLKGLIEKVNFKNLGFTNFDLKINTLLDIKIKGLEIEKMVGSAVFNKLNIQYNGKSLAIDSLDLFSHKYANNRSFILNSNMLYLTALGDFEFKEIIQDAEMFLKEYQLYFQHNDLKTAQYYAEKKNMHHNSYKLAYHMLVKNINPLLNVVLPGWYFAKNTYLKGSLNNGASSSFEVEGKISSFGYKNFIFQESNIDFSTEKVADSTKVLAMCKFNSVKQLYNGKPVTKNLAFSGKWVDDNIDFSTAIDHFTYKNHANVEGTLSFLHNEMQLYMERIDLTALDKFWQLEKEKLVIFKENDVLFDSLSLVNEDQKISLSGVLSAEPSDILNLQFNNFQINNLNSIFAGKYEGIANGFVSIKDIYKTTQLQGNVDIVGLKVENIEIGDLNAWAAWNNDLKNIALNANLRKNNMPVISVFGNYNPYDELNPLDLKAELNKSSLKILETFLSSYASDFQGEATGSFSVKGSLAEPIVEGSAYVHLGGFKVNYLNTYYKFSESVYINKSKIYVQNARLLDQNNNLLLVNGGLEHQYFKNFKVKLKGEMEDFMVFNIPLSKDALYYGTAIVNGNVAINGYFDDITISGDFVSEQGTKLYIPMTWLNYVQQKDYIKFTNHNTETEEVTTKKPSINLSGIKLDVNLDINPNAFCEIIFDARTGDIIKGRGNGKLNLEIDTKGDFAMQGNYVFTEGDYHFTFLNVINKEFKIKPGSSIQFAGPVYEGLLDIQVFNEQNISYYNIGGESITKNDSSLLSLGYPVFVNLFLKGELTKPLVTTGIELKNPSNLDPLLLDFKNKIATNEQELNRQVFSLLVFRAFAKDQLFSGSNASAATGRTLTELLSNQLNNWISQVDPNFQVDIQANELSAAQLNYIKVGLYYQFNDRTRLTRNGAIANSLNQATASTLLGEIAIEYSLNASGSIRLKAYTKPNQSSLIGGSSSLSSAQQGGVSILHTKAFERFKELFARKQTKKVADSLQ